MHNHDLPPAPRAAGADQVLAGYLQKQAGDFLRGLRLHGECGADTHGAADAARTLRGAAHRIRGTLHTFRALLDPAWADQLRTELAWLSGVLAEEHACTARLTRLLDALARLSGTQPVPAARTSAGGPATPGRAEGRPTPEDTGADPAPAPVSGADPAPAPVSGADPAPAPASGADPAPAPASGAAPAAGRRGALTVGGARAGALLERQLTLGRTRAHSAALQALGSSRFHAVADAVALLASEVPLAATAGAPGAALAAHAEIAERRLLDAVTALPLARAAHPYNAEALIHGLATASAGEAQDAPWHQVRHLLRLHAYAQEVLHARGGTGPGRRLVTAGRALDRHRDAAEAAAAAATAARTPRIAPATAYALGVLHADQRHEVEAARFAFQRAWQEVAHGPDGPRDEHALAAP